MLNKRQQYILKDLESTVELLTAKKLSQKYGVSLRTVRNDINAISNYIDDKDVSFVKIPGVGMRITSEKSLTESLEQNISVETLSTYNNIDRENLILLYFLVCENPLTAEFLSKRMMLSHGTIVNTLKSVNLSLKQYNLVISGKKNHGYELNGDELDVLSLINDLIPQISKPPYRKVFSEFQNNIFSSDDLLNIRLVIKYIKDTLNWTIINESILYIWITFFIRRSIFGQNLVLTHSYYMDFRGAESFYKFEMLSEKIHELFNVELNEAQKIFLTYIVLNNIHWKDENFFQNFDDHLVSAIDALIKEVSLYFPSITSEIEVLRTDLTNHIQLSINRYKLKLPKPNPVLDQIKASYGDVFSIVNKSSKAFYESCGIRLSEDELGYITLYFCKSLEISNQVSNTHILVVCNTGMGASKLLATRLKNNLPGIQICGIVSADEVEHQLSILDNIDIVLSTVPLSDLNIPVIITSPIISEIELSKIREAIFIGVKKQNILFNNDFQSTINSLISKYVPRRNSTEFSEKLEHLIQYTLNQKMTITSNNSELYVNVVAELTNMVSKLFPDGLTMEQFYKISGIIVHCQMSISRWEKGIFISVDDYSFYKKNYGDKLDIIEKTLNKIGESLHTYINPIEAVAIIRYLV